MERATAFTAVPGWGGVGMGVLGAAGRRGVARPSRRPPSGWPPGSARRCVALTLGGWAMAGRRGGRARPVFSYSGRRFVLSYVPPLARRCAAHRGAWSGPGSTQALPGTWLLLYGTGVVTGGAFSVRVVPLMGLCFMALGARRAVRPGGLGQRAHGRGLRLLHIVFGLIIARRYGG